MSQTLVGNGIAVNFGFKQTSTDYGITQTVLTGYLLQSADYESAADVEDLDFVTARLGFAHDRGGDIEGLDEVLEVGALAADMEAEALDDEAQGEGGLDKVSPAFARALQEVCKRHDILIIADEIQGGYGRTGTFFAWQQLGLKPDTDIKVLKQGFNVDPLLQNQAACISTMIYNEYWQVVDAGVKESDLVTFFYEKEGVASLEDGLYVLESNLKDPAFVARMAKFLKASFKGWNDAVKNPAEAAKIVVAGDTSGSANEAVQKRQMENVAKLITNAGTAKIGYLEPSAYERTVKVLLSSGSAPVIKKDPGKAAYSHAVWEASSK